MNPVFIDNVEYQTNLSEAEIKVARADIQKGQNLSKSCLSMLAVAVKHKDTQIMHLMTEVLLTHPMILLAASVQANNKVKQNKRCSLEQCFEASKKLNLFNKIEEISEVYPKKKSSGGVRMIHKPSFLHRVAQTAVKNVMEVFFQPRKWQYTHQGVPRAIRHIKERFNSGHHYFCHLDIKSFYEHFQLEELIKFLPLPKEVVENVVSATCITTLLSPSTEHRTHPIKTWLTAMDRPKQRKDMKTTKEKPSYITTLSTTKISYFISPAWEFLRGPFVHLS